MDTQRLNVTRDPMEAPDPMEGGQVRSPEDPPTTLECVQGCWYARDVDALLAAPALPAGVRAVLLAWVRSNDIHIQTRRPFALLPDGCYSFDWRYRRAHGAPAWWVAAADAWTATHGGTQ